jgi:hypothetical protein
MKRTLLGLQYRVLGLLALVLFAGGCANVLDTPKPAAGKAGTVTLSVDRGFIGNNARTAVPAISQFNKITLSFAGTEGTADLGDADATAGSATVTLPVGSWNVRARAYINTDDTAPAAESDPRTVSWDGDTLSAGAEAPFILKPSGTGAGTLKYTVTASEGIVLGNGSRIQIEKDGAVFTELETDGFSGGRRTITGSVSGETVSLAAGRYIADILLVTANSDTAIYRETVVILEGLGTEISFSPQSADFMSGETRAALTGITGIEFGATADNTSGISVGQLTTGSGGYNQNITAPNGKTTVYFTVIKPSTVAITYDTNAHDTNAVAVTEALEGTTPTGDLLIFQIDTEDIAASGGTKSVSLSAREEGKEGVTITVGVTVAVGYIDTLEFDSIEAMAAALESKPQNNEDTPYYVKLTSNVSFADMGGKIPNQYGNPPEIDDALEGIFAAAKGKYVVLDLNGIAKGPGGDTKIPARNNLVQVNYKESSDRLVEIILPDWVTEIGNFAFYGRTMLKSINMPDSLTTIGTAAFTKTALTSLVFPASITTFRSNPFEECTQLKSVDFGACTSLTVLSDRMFKDCTALDTIVNWPPNLKNTASAFANTGFVTLDIPEHLEYVGFSGPNLTWVRWPASTAAKPVWGFSGPNLVKVELPAGVDLSSSSLGGLVTYLPFVTLVLHSTTPPAVSYNSFYLLNSGNKVEHPIKVYVPDGYGDTYKNATNGWKAYWPHKVFEMKDLADKPENWTAPTS